MNAARVELGACTWLEIDARPTPPLLAVPIGSCEQHGPHLPLDTDTIVAVALAERLAADVPDVIVAPPLTITASGEHDGFPGTLSIGTEATAHVIVELSRSASWASGVVLVNGHGGNADAVEQALTVLRGEGREVLAWWPSVQSGDAHAGRTETALLLALAPERVRIGELAAGVTEPLTELGPRLRRHGVRAVSANGVLGDPRRATAAEGTALLDELVADLTGAVAAWRGAGVGPRESAPSSARPSGRATER